MNIDEHTLRELAQPIDTRPAPIRPLGQIQQRAGILRRRRRLAQAGGTGVLTAALALAVTQVGLPHPGGNDGSRPATQDIVETGRWTVADAQGLFYAPDRALSGPPVSPVEIYDLSQPCAGLRAVTIAYHVQDGVVRDSLYVEGPYTDEHEGAPPDNVAVGGPTLRQGSVDGRPATIAEYPGDSGASAYWRGADGHWWHATVNGFTGTAQRTAALGGLGMSGRTLRTATIPRALEVRPKPTNADGCRGEHRQLSLSNTFVQPVVEEGGWALSVSEGESRYDGMLTTPGVRIVEVHGRPAVWRVHDTPLPSEGGEPPHRNLLWQDASGREFEIVADPTMTLQRALRIAESVRKVDAAGANVPAADITNRRPLRTK